MAPTHNLILYIAVHILLIGGCCIRILLRPHRQPESRMAWLAVIFALPYLGVVAYLLLGETNIGRRRAFRLEQTFTSLPRPDEAPGWTAPQNAAGDQGRHATLFQVGETISGYKPIGGNHARLTAGSEAAIADMIADIDHAVRNVHLLFYIWLDDDMGRAVAAALERAAARGVICRAIVDDLGSRRFIRSARWKALAAAGVRTARALPIGNPMLRAVMGRIDLRNHRKIVVIDNQITYCGSQNCASAAFLPKAKYAPWVDVLVRFEGPIARQNQHLFASDWMGAGGDDISDMLRDPLPPTTQGFTAQVIGTGPTFRNAAMSEMFETLIYAASRELVISTPYYIPSAGLQAALRAAANRGVDTTIIFPARNDDFAVAAASRSYYQELLEAGVKIYEYKPGLLHTKSMTIDGEIVLIGSANMDRRSFDLNYENNILLLDNDICYAMRGRQQTYLESSQEIRLEDVLSWNAARRIWQNTLAILGPIL